MRDSPVAFAGSASPRWVPGGACSFAKSWADPLHCGCGPPWIRSPRSTQGKFRQKSRERSENEQPGTFSRHAVKIHAIHLFRRGRGSSSRINAVEIGNSGGQIQRRGEGSHGQDPAACTAGDVGWHQKPQAGGREKPRQWAFLLLLLPTPLPHLSAKRPGACRSNRVLWFSSPGEMLFSGSLKGQSSCWAPGEKWGRMWLCANFGGAAFLWSGVEGKPRRQ